jgi:hypothetical protein
MQMMWQFSHFCGNACLEDTTVSNEKCILAETKGITNFREVPYVSDITLWPNFLPSL